MGRWGVNLRNQVEMLFANYPRKTRNNLRVGVEIFKGHLSEGRGPPKQSQRKTQRWFRVREHEEHSRGWWSGVVEEEEHRRLTHRQTRTHRGRQESGRTHTYIHYGLYHTHKRQLITSLYSLAHESAQFTKICTTPVTMPAGDPA